MAQISGQGIQIPVSLGLQTAEGQVKHLQEILQNAVKVNSSAFQPLNTALKKAEETVSRLKSQMNTAFQTTQGSKQFLSEYNKLFETLSSIGNRFSFLKEADMIFSPESSAELKNMRNELAELEGQIKQIKSGKVGKLFEDASTDSIKEVQEVANQLQVTLSKTTFQDFSQKISGEMAKTESQIKATREQIELLNKAANGTELNKQSVFSQLNMEKLMGNTSEIIDKDAAKTLREKISKLYEDYGLTDVELSKSIRANGNIDQIFIAEEERVKASAEKYVGVLEEQKKKIEEEIKKFDEGLKQSGGDGKRANWETKLAYIDEIKQKFAGLLSFSDIPASVLKNGEGITKYVETFKQELIDGMNKLSTNDITKILQGKVQEIFSGVSTKSVITDADTFKTQVTTMLRDIFGNLDLTGVTDEVKNGWGIEDALDRILVNIKNKIDSSGGVEALNKQVADLEAAFEKLKRAGETVRVAENSETGSLKEKEQAYADLTQKVLDFVAARLGLTTTQVAQILQGDTEAINNGKTALEQYIQSLTKLESKQKTLSGVQSAVTRWMGFYQVLNLTKRAINDMKQHIQELDTVMTQIAVVTNMSQEQLWGQIGKYSQIARQYGVAIKGVYEVSQIYYQQGLESNDVMTLTTETLKMARIAGLDYATAADYMTTAIRGFKLEMTDAAHVTDVFSALAASTASSTEELAVAISKTAASAANVGSSFEATSAMMATMIATTRESATNIGTALKSIISRYGEMKGKPEGTDAEGEEYSLNKVDKALQSIGVTIHTTTGEFRDFDEVILELAEKWDTLDSVSQRYIATIMAGNRQQSRFLALVSNVDEYKRALEVAQGSEGSGELQMLKTLDSVDAKLEKMRVTIQEFYTSSGLEQLYKNIIDGITNIISAANSMPKIFDKIPLQAIAVGGALVSAVKGFLTLIIAEVQQALEQTKGSTTSVMNSIIQTAIQKGQEGGQNFGSHFAAAAAGAMQGLGTSIKTILLKNLGPTLNILGSILTISGLNDYGKSSTEAEDHTAGTKTIGGALLGVAGSAASGAAMGASAGPHGMIIGGLIGAAQGLITNGATLITGIQQFNVTLARSVELAEKRATEEKTKAEKQQAETKNLEQAIEKYKILEAQAYKSAEGAQEFTDYMNQLAESYPALIAHLDEQGNYILELDTLEQSLAASREKTAIATANATLAELSRQKKYQEAYQKTSNDVAQVFDLKNMTNQNYAENIKNIAQERGAAGLFTYLTNNSDFHELETYAGRKDIKFDNYASILQLYNNGVSGNKKINFNIEATNEELQSIIDDNIEQIANYYANLLSTMQHSDVGDATIILKRNIDALQKIDDSLSLQYLTGIENINSIGELKPEQVYSALMNLQRVAEENISQWGQSIDNVANTLIRNKVSTDLSRMDFSGEEINMYDHEKLISNLIAGQEKFQNLSSEETEKLDTSQETQAYVDYFKAHNNAIKFLEEQLDFNKISNNDELLSLLESNIETDDDTNIDELIKEYYINKYQNIASNIADQFENALWNVFNSNEIGMDALQQELYTSLKELLEEEKVGEYDNISLISPLISQVQSLLPYYQQLLKDTPQAANNYIHSIIDIFTSIGQLSGSLQEQISSIITNIDFRDTDSLQTAIDSLTDMGSDYTEIVSVLQQVQKNLLVNVKIQASAIQDGLGEYAESIEKIISNFGKELDYSTALKSALEIMETDTTVKLEDLIKQTDEGKWILTEQAQSIQIKQIADKQKKTLENLKAQAQNKISLYEKILQAPDEAIGRLERKITDDDEALEIEEYIIDDKSLYSFLEGKYSGEELALAKEEIEQRYDDYQKWLQIDSKNTGTFLDYLKQEKTDLNDIISQIVNYSETIEQDIANSYLKSFDYKSLVTGNGTEQSKSTLYSLLNQAIGDTQLPVQRFNEQYAKLIAGNIESWNAYIDELNSRTGANLSRIKNGEANRARFEALKNLYDKIASGDVVYDALEPQEKQLLEATNKLYGFAPTDMANGAQALLNAIWNLYNTGVFSLKEMEDSVAKAAENDFKDSNAGKAYNLLTSYKEGFTAPEASELGLLDEEGKLKQEFTKVLKQDENGNYIAQAGQSAASVLQYLAEQLGIKIDKTTKAYKNTIKEDTDNQIKQNEENNQDKQFQKVLSQIFSGTEGQEINISEISSNARRALRLAGYNISGNILTIGTQQAMIAAAQALNNQAKKGGILDTNYKLSAKDIRANAQNIEAATAKNAAFEDVIGETVSKSAAQALSMALQNTDDFEEAKTLMMDLGYEWDEGSQVFNTTFTAINNVIDKIIEALRNDELDFDDAYKLLATIKDTQDILDPQLKKNKSVVSILQNYANISQTAISDFKSAFSTDIALKGLDVDWNTIFKKNADGITELDLSAFLELLSQLGFSLTDAAQEQVNVITDTFSQNISKALSLVSQGTTSVDEASKFAEMYNKEMGANLSIDELFDYSSITKSWVLKSELIRGLLEKEAEQLNILGDEANQWIEDQLKSLFAEDIDFSALFNHESTQIQKDTLTKQLQDYTKINANKIFGQTNWENWSEEVQKSIVDSYVNNILAVISGGGAAAVKKLKEINPEATAQELEETFSHGFTELQNAFNQAADLTEGSFVATNTKLYEILHQIRAVDEDGVIKSGLEMASVYEAIYNEMKTTNGNTLGGLNEAYAKVLNAQDQQNIDVIDALQNASGMTYDALGKMLATYGKSLEDYMSNPSFFGLERTGFGKVKIIDWESFAKSIFNVEDLASIQNTDEYISAFKAYNDNLISLNKKTEKAIVDEVKQIENAKGGDWLNLTEFSNQYFNALAKSINVKDYLKDSKYQGQAEAMAESAQKYNESIIRNLNIQLSQFDAKLDNGILKLGDNANLLGIAQTLETASAEAGLKIGEGLEEVKDAVLNVLKSYTEAITKGIEGGLSNTEAADLVAKAQTLGVTDIKFDKTVDGLKLCQASATELYFALSKVNGLQGKIVFDKLADSLKETNENFATTSALLSHMVDLRTKLSSIDASVPDSRRQEYEAELELAKQIVAVRSAAEDDSFNFMDNKIPAGQNNPLNYAKNWTKALKEIKDAYKVKNTKDLNAGGVKHTRTGYMGYESFYNIVNELNNMAGVMGQSITIGKDIRGKSIELNGDLTSASNAIMAGIETLTAVDTGDMMVNIGALGLNLEKGGKDFEKSVDAGINAIADSQIKALDGLIAMLELIVAMEQLGDITGEDTTIDLGDIFAVDGKPAALDNIEDINEFTKEFDQARQRLFDYLSKPENAKAQEMFKNTKMKIGNEMRSMFDMMDPTKQFYDLFPKDLTPEQKASAVQSYQGLINALYQAAISGNYNLDDIAGSLQEILNSTGYQFDDSFMLDVGDITYTVQSGVVVEAIDWSTDQAQKVLNQYKKDFDGDESKAKAQIVSEIQDYLNGKGQTGALTVDDILALRHNTIIKKDKKGSYILGPDGKTKYRQGDKEYDKIANKLILEDQQGIDSSATFNEDNSEATITYGKKMKIKMVAKIGADGKIIWTALDYNNVPGLEGFKPSNEATTQEALLEEMYNYANENTKDENGDQVTFPTKEAWIYQTFGIHVKVQPEVYKDNEKVDDPTHDNKFRKEVDDLLNKSDDELKKLAEQGANQEGKTTIELGHGYKMVLDMDDISYDGKTVDPELLRKKLLEATGMDDILKQTIIQAIIEAFKQLPEAIKELNDMNIDGIKNIINAIEQVGSKSLESKSAVDELTAAIEALFALFGVNLKFPKIPNKPENKENKEGENPPGFVDPNKNKFPEPSYMPTGTSTPNPTPQEFSFNNGNGPVNSNLAEIAGTLNITNVKTDGIQDVEVPGVVKVSEVNTENVKAEVEGSITAPEGGFNIQAKGNIQWDPIKPPVIPPIVKGTIKWGPIPPPVKDVEINGKINWSDTTPPVGGTGTSPAIGTFGLGDGTLSTLGKANAKGTLMGELGPELVVSNGRYFVAGQSGPEMVDLSKDAIVFNHLQTESLLKHGMSKERGRAVTNERNAVAFATGNINGGPAMASASAALAALKQLRAMWESLRNASVSDLAGAGGGGGGGGGGGNDKIATPKEWVELVERWYNLMQEIAKLEQKITHEEALRSKIQSDFQKNGKHYYASLKSSLKSIRAEQKAQEELNLSREVYYEKRREALKDTPLGQVYEFDEEGQLKFKTDLDPSKFNGFTSAMEFLTDLMGKENGQKARYTNKEKYNLMIAAGFGEYMKYDENGTEIKKSDFSSADEYYAAVTQNAWDTIDEYKESMQSLYDSIEEGKVDLLEELEKENEYLAEMRDNQKEVEETVYDAIVESREREIQALEDQRDALEDSVGKYIDGLSEALDKEQEMYDKQDQEDELNRNRRRLAILQRAGGSVSDINALQAEIRDQEREMYFDAQQAQIDAIQEASDKEIERLDNQIDIMNQQLEYQKQYGLLWNDVYQIMSGPAEYITSFINGNSADFWAASPLSKAEKANDILFKAVLWKEYAEDVETIAEVTREQRKEQEYQLFDEAMKKETGNEDYDASGKYKEKFDEIYDATGDVTAATTAVKTMIANDSYDAARQKEAGDNYIGDSQYRYEQKDKTYHWVYEYEQLERHNGQWTYKGKYKEKHDWGADKVCTKCGRKKSSSSGGGSSGGGDGIGDCANGGCTGHCGSACSGACTNAANRKAEQSKKASGGYVSHGLYELGERGTETVLTAQQTRVLRNNILSNRPSSLISLLKTYNEGFSRMETPLTGTVSEDNSTNIDKIEFSMNVQQISNDYDARRAGEQAMNEMMRIARKTSAANSIRR